MYKRTQYGIEYAGNSQRNGGKVQNHGRCQIDVDGAHDLPRQHKQMRYFPYIIVHKCNIRRFNGNITTNAAHRNAHLGGFAGGGVADAIAHHADRLSVFLILLDSGQLIFGQAIRVNITVVDYITGIAKAVHAKTLSSETGFRGIAKKVLTLSVVALAFVLDQVTGGVLPLREVTIVFFIANEGLSILENAAGAGLPIPQKLVDALEQLGKSRGGQ